jgi:hypothetical protein
MTTIGRIEIVTSQTFKLPSFRSYGNYSSENYGAHCLVIDFGPVTVWFSYKTPIAFHVEGHSRVVLKNYWSTTTGKHLNAIDGGNKKGRVDQETFDRLWAEQVEAVFNPQPKSDPDSPFNVGALN